ncbi:MAG: DUF6089 family protein [Bacteroidetes bacterium]|jgi:hypothetical protein|nr:DUF6089 family protein [Bacteroidota bacterium]
MKSRLVFAIASLSLLSIDVGAQRYKKYRWEAGIDVGAANFLGDLGGANQIGTNGFKDLELSMTQPTVGAHVSYRKARYVGYKAQFIWGRVEGNDALTTEKYRNNRNLYFRSNIFEFNSQIEFYLTRERTGHRYNYNKPKGLKNIDFQAYTFVGVGGFYFDPQAYFAPIRQWISLRELRTEGQGLKPNTSVYSTFSVCVPIGFGMKYGINKRWSLGIEYGMRKTFTDYIDDVSTVYYDRNIIAAAQTDPFLQQAAYFFANPTTGAVTAANNDGVDPTGIGQQRGDSSDNDAYMFGVITINCKIGKVRRTKSKF